MTKPAEQMAEGFVGPCLFNATNHGMHSTQGSLKSHGPFGNIHLDNAYAEQAGWPHGWSLHYNKVTECWWEEGWSGDEQLSDKTRTHLHKSLHMGMGRACGALLGAVVTSGAWVPIPIPGSMITNRSLSDYLKIEPHPPSLYLNHKGAMGDEINGIDDITASMVVAHNVRTHVPPDDAALDCNKGRFEYHIYDASAPANRRNYKPGTFNPVALAQREWPHVYPEHVGTIPMAVYAAYEPLPVQRTAELHYMAPSRRTDSNPNDLDTIGEARVRSQIIKEHVTYPYLKAETLIDSVSSHNPADRHLHAAKAWLAAVADERIAAATGECWAANISDTLAVPRQECRNCGKAWLCTNTPPEMHELCSKIKIKIKKIQGNYVKMIETPSPLHVWRNLSLA